MKLAVAQLRPIVGPVERNIDLHLALIELGERHGANLLIFPELSLTGYEPTRAAELSRASRDSFFAKFQSVCDAKSLAVGIGVPLRATTLPYISTVLFRPQLQPHIYSKRYLHEDERAFFRCGTEVDATIHADPRVSLAICYELSVPEHARMAFAAGATAYIASVAKTAGGVENASQRLSGLANEHAALVMMSNCLGILDGTACVGRSAAWRRDGSLLARLDDASDGVIVVDHETEETVTDVLTSAVG